MANDSVQETSATTGTGTWSLAGPSAGHASFAAFVSSGGQCYYHATDGSSTEDGIGTFTSGTTNTLSRDTIISSTTGSKINYASTVTLTLGSIPVPASVVSGSGASTPLGRLTLQSGAPVQTADQSAKGTVYYDSHIGNLVPVWDGSSMVPLTIGSDEISLILDTSSHLLNNVYDVFGYSASGTLTLGTGPAWSNTATITVTIATPAVVSWTAHGLAEGAPVVFTNSGGALPTGITAGTTYFVGRSPGTNSFNISTSVANAAAGTFVSTSGSQSGTHTGANHTTTRGTGAGTTELQRKNGLWTNKNSITLTNNSATASIAANKATYLGSIFCTANGQTGMVKNPAAAAGGGNPTLGVYNAYNRVRTAAVNMDSNGPTVSTQAWQAYGGSMTNRVTFLDGLQQSEIVGFTQALQTDVHQPAAAILLDSTNGSPNSATTTNTATGTFNSGFAIDSWAPKLGVHYGQQAQRNFSSGSSTAGFGQPWDRIQIELDM